MKKSLKNILILTLIIIKSLVLTNSPSFALCYSSKTNGEEIHQRSCADVFQATGLLSVYFDDNSSLIQCGTATLIAPDVLITAAHVLLKPGQQIKEVIFQPECNPTSYRTYDMLQAPKNVWIHPNYAPGGSDHDIAIVQLAQPFNNIRPAQLQKTLPNDFTSAYTTVVGYGRSGNNYECGIVRDRKRRAGDIELLSDFFKKSQLHMPFTPNTYGTGFIDSSNGSKYAAITAKGDSGGPAFIHINGEPSAQILGILQGSEKTSYTHSISNKNLFMSIPYYYPWIESILTSCGHSNIANSQQSVAFDYNQPKILDARKSKASTTDYKKDQNGKDQEDAAWNTLEDMLATASQQGAEILQSLYDYAATPENKKAFEDALSSVSTEALELLYEFIAINKKLFFG